jgi:nitrous oxidase accessory protein NosD
VLAPVLACLALACAHSVRAAVSVADYSSLQAAIDAAQLRTSATQGSGQTVLLADGASYEVSADLHVRAGVTLSGNYVFSATATTLNRGSGGPTRLRLLNGARLLMYNGAQLDGVMLVNGGLPAGAVSAANFSGTAIEVTSADAYLRNVALLGFQTGVVTRATVNTPRLRMNGVSIDAIHGVHIHDSGDVTSLSRLRIFPFLTSDNAADYRDGIGVRFGAYITPEGQINGNDWSRIEESTIHAHAKGILVENSHSTWIDRVTIEAYARSGATGTRGTGIEIRDAATESILTDNTVRGHEVAVRLLPAPGSSGERIATLHRVRALENTTGLLLTRGWAQIDECTFSGRGGGAIGVALNYASARVSVADTTFQNLAVGIDDIASAQLNRAALTHTNVTTPLR